VRAPVEYKGKDILLVTGSDGKHPLDSHRTAIKANREDYAAFHSKRREALCLS